MVEIGLVVLEKKILKFRQYILAIFFYLPFEKGESYYLNKLEFPLSKDVLCEVWSKLTQCLEKKMKM